MHPAADQLHRPSPVPPKAGEPNLCTRSRQGEEGRPGLGREVEDPVYTAMPIRGRRCRGGSGRAVQVDMCVVWADDSEPPEQKAGVRRIRMSEPVRRKVKWPTGRRRGKTRVWKSKWVVVVKSGERKPKG